MILVSNGNSQSLSKPNQKASIMAWNTELPIICSPFESTFNVSKSMAAKRCNCALVKDFSRNKVIGIFTAKDLAFKVVAKGLHPKLLKAKDIMTGNPICATVDEPASSALNKMIKYKIRHLPVLDEYGDVAGMLDVTKAFTQTVDRLRKLHETSRKLNEALNEVQENIAGMDHNEANVNKHSEMYYQAQDMVLKAKNNISNLYQNNLALTGDSGDFDDFEMLLNLIESPTLEDVLRVPNHPQTLFIDANNTIRSAADIMKKNNTTAVLVRDTTTSAKSVIGILTTKDIVYRVLAQEYEPDFTIITRIMTPSPEFGDKDMGIVQALEIMYNGNFLNLPVTDENHNVIGIVSVLQLTNMALLQLHRGMMSDEDADKENFGDTFSDSGAANPKWDRFWGAMDTSKGLEDDTGKSDYSVRSNGPGLRSPAKSSISIHNSNLKKKTVLSSRSPNLGGTPSLGGSQTTKSIANATSSNNYHESTIRSAGYYDDDFDANSLPASEVSPEDSISCYIPPESEVNSIVSYTSELRKQSVGAGSGVGGPSSIIRAQKQSFVFKLKDLDDSNRVHKIKIMLPRSKNVLPNLKVAIEEKLNIAAKDIGLSYIDEDEDMVSIETEEDLKTSIDIATANRKPNITLCLSRGLISQDQFTANKIALDEVSKLRTKLEMKERANHVDINSATDIGAVGLLQKPEILISGALFTLSLGILLGITLSRQK